MMACSSISTAPIFRNNLPGGLVTPTTLASTALGGADETTWLTAAVNPALLVVGTNIVVAEIHQSSTNSSDINCALELIGCTTAVLPRLSVTAQESAFTAGWPGWATGCQMLFGLRLFA
jgi:hypothetical protein